MGIGAQEAAQAVGITKQGIIKSIKSGKLSAQKDNNGAWVIEPVELFRVYDPVGSPQSSPQSAPQAAPQDQPVELEVLRVENRLLRDQLVDKDDTIADLRGRLDEEADERRKLTMMLTAAPAPPAPKPKGFWARLLGG